MPQGGQKIYHQNYNGKAYGNQAWCCIRRGSRRAVIRETSDPGDVIILLGGRTGRDGCGGPPDLSKSIQKNPLKPAVQGAEGNPPTEKRYKDFSEEERSQPSDPRNVMTLAQAESLLPLEELADGLKG